MGTPTVALRHSLEPEEAAETNLRTILRVTSEVRWKGTRSERCRISSAAAVVRWLESQGVTRMDDITTDHMLALRQSLHKQGNGAATVQWKLSALYTMGAVAQSHRPPLAKTTPPHVEVKRPKLLKWWLTPEKKDALLPWARAAFQDGGMTADFFEFVFFTGLRVEEALRLQASHFSGLSGPSPIVTVPGLKTAAAQATLPIKAEAAAVAIRRIAEAGGMGRLFPISYEVLKKRWILCRKFLGFQDSKTCSLRALRRSFAKMATDSGMPTEVLRVYLRHTDIKTTIGYLQVVGGYETETVRKWL